MASLCRCLLSIPSKLCSGILCIKLSLSTKLESWKGRQCVKTDDQQQVGPVLWETLPAKIVDRIVDKILVDLPFSSMLSFCGICKQWKDFLLSNEYLVYVQEGECHLFNPRRNQWESISMQFVKVDELTAQNLEVTTFTGGLFMFDTKMEDEYIVCNPLTKRVKRYDRRCVRGEERAMHGFGGFVRPTMKVRATWHSLGGTMGHPLLYCMRNLEMEVQVCLTVPEWFLQLSVSQWECPAGCLRVRDSRSDAGWRTISQVPEDFCFFANQAVVVHRNSVIALGVGSHSSGFNVLLYDLHFMMHRWEWREGGCQVMQKAMGRVNKVLMVPTAPLDDHWHFFEVEDKARLSTRKDVEPPLQTSSETVWTDMVLGVPERLYGRFLCGRMSTHTTLFSIGQEDIAVYYIGVQGSLISVLRYNNDGCSKFTLNWDSRDYRRTRLLDLGDFHIFKPSLSPA